MSANENHGMDQYCLMGNPVEHSKSPWIHARFAQLSGQSLEYGKRLVPLDGFAQAVRDFRAAGGKGCNVTVPFKFEAGALATRMTPRAQLAQAANVLMFDGDAVLADNSDGIGLANDIRHNAGVAIAGRDLLLVGAGGAAAGVLGPLLEAAPRRVVIANRTVGKAQEIVARHAQLAQTQGAQLSACALDAVEGAFDIVINATASSLAGAGVPVNASVLKPGALACDLMYGPAAQGFLDWAREHGAVPRDGLGMLVEQAAEAFALWRGVRPPSRQVLAELRASLEPA
jgi:shikimate dehydrogenase